MDKGAIQWTDVIFLGKTVDHNNIHISTCQCNWREKDSGSDNSLSTSQCWENCVPDQKLQPVENESWFEKVEQNKN